METRELLREIDLINVKVRKLQGEIFQFRYGITREDSFFQKLIDTKKPVVIFFCSGEKDTVIIESNFRHCFVAMASDDSHLIIQKSSLKYIAF